MVRIEHLHGERFPSAGGAAVNEARPALADGAEIFFDRGNQLGFDGVAVRAEVRGIHGVGIVVIRIGVIDLRDEEARKFRRNPLLIELVGFFLLNSVVAGNVEAFAVVGFQIRIGRSGAEAVEVVVEMIFENHQRKMRVGVGSRILRGPGRWR